MDGAEDHSIARTKAKSQEQNLTGAEHKLKSVEEIKAAIEAAVPGATVMVLPNPAPSAQHSLIIDAQHAVSVAEFLRDDDDLALVYLSNATGVDYLDKEIAEKV
jgi:NADH-quinone oxidoreductase subunit C